MNKRIEWIDVAKGLSIILVIIGHTIIGTEFSEFNKIIFSFHMPIFFIISGYLYKDEGVKKCIYKNIKRLIAPYWITVLCILLGRICILVINNQLNSVIDIIKNTIISALFGYGVDNAKGFEGIWMIGAIWFLLAMFWAILFYCIILKITKNKTESEVFFIILIFSIIGYLIGQKVWIPLNIDIGMTSTLYLYVGTIIKNKNLVERDLSIFVYIIMSILWIVEIKFDIIKAIFSYAGKNSLYILCFHLFEMMIIPWNKIIEILNLQLNNIFILMQFKILLAILFCYIINIIKIKLNEKKFYKK